VPFVISGSQRYSPICCNESASAERVVCVTTRHKWHGWIRFFRINRFSCDAGARRQLYVWFRAERTMTQEPVVRVIRRATSGAPVARRIPCTFQRNSGGPSWPPWSRSRAMRPSKTCSGSASRTAYAHQSASANPAHIPARWSQTKTEDGAKNATRTPSKAPSFWQESSDGQSYGRDSAAQ